MVAVEAVSRAAILAEWTGARIHILHISSAEELRPLREAKARGVDITGETCPHYLLLSTDDYARFAGVIRVNPPVREARNQQPLWDALADGTIDVIATDHAPHSPEEKTRNDIWTVDCGFPGVETQMPLMLTEVNAGRFSICDYVRWSAANPAKIWGLYPRKGVIQPGADADIAVVDLAREWTIDDAKLQSLSKITPFHGRRVKGLPIHTLVRGRFVMKDRTLVPGTRGWGRSVHAIQNMPPPRLRNTDQTMQAIVRGRRRRPSGSTPHEASQPFSTCRSPRRNRTSRRDAFVELEKVTHTYGRGERQVHALTETNLRIEQGDFVALVGPSGCGKSTILKLVTGLINASSGYVYVAGRQVGAEPVRVGMAFQNPTLLPWLTLLDNVMLPLKIVPPFRQEYRAKRKSEFRDQIEALLAQVGLAGFSNKYPWQLSGGMMQRASLCRALIHEPQLLMLDEPFGALDQFTREELWGVMQDLWMTRKPTVLLVTHDLKEAAFLANRICVMAARPGRIIDDSVVPFPRPRTVEMSYDPNFVALTQRLREMIVHAQPPKEAAP